MIEAKTVRNPTLISNNPISGSIGRYLRISHEDDRHDESNSITNQRRLIDHFIENNEEFKKAEILEYVDDGISGSHTDRPAYQKLMADIQKGSVQCIIVKDLSRIGRNLIDVDELLMNKLVSYNIRFIAINNGYDSFKSPLSNLELAIINLANEHYTKDLAQKSITSKHVKMKKGEYLSCYAPFGYRKSNSQKNQLVIDEEAAQYVRLMFSLAADGKSRTEIAAILNAQGVPTPSVYKRKQGIDRKWKTIDENYTFWCNSLVGNIINDERYTGTSVHNKHVVKESGKGSCVLRPKDEWIIVPDAHDAIVSREIFEKVQINHTPIPPVDHIFYGKVRCPICHRTMRRSGKKNPIFKCITPQYTDYYDCPRTTISQSVIEETVINSIRVYSSVLLEKEELKREAKNKERNSKAATERMILVEERQVSLLEESIAKNFEALMERKITQEEFISKKQLVNDTINQKMDKLKHLRISLEAIGSDNKTISQNICKYKEWLSLEKLNREIIDLLVDTIYPQDDKNIEIIWAGKS